MGVPIGSGNGSGTYQPQKKKKPKKVTKPSPLAGTQGRGGAQQYVPPQSAPPRPEPGFPFKNPKYTPKYASESKRLVDLLHINIEGVDQHSNPDVLYSDIANAIHRLPTSAWAWLQDHGKNVTIKVTADGSILLPGGQRDSDIGSRVGGYYSPGDQTIVAGANRRGGIGTGYVLTHEFAHWIDAESARLAKMTTGRGRKGGGPAQTTGGYSASNPSLFGSVDSMQAPHDERQWERFANTFRDYVASPQTRAGLDPGVVKFFDHFVGPFLNVDSEPGNGRRRARSLLVKRIAAIKVAHSEGLFKHMYAAPLEFEKLLREIEKSFDGGGG